MLSTISMLVHLIGRRFVSAQECTRDRELPLVPSQNQREATRLRNGAHFGRWPRLERAFSDRGGRVATVRQKGVGESGVSMQAMSASAGFCRPGRGVRLIPRAIRMPCLLVDLLG